MDLQAFVIQCAISIPIIVGLVVYSLMRWDRTPLHMLVVVLLASVVPWLGGQVLKLAGGESQWALLGLHAEQLSIAVMPSLFVVTMGHFARVRFLDFGRPIPTILLCLPLLLGAAYGTDGFHHLYFADRAAALSGAHPSTWAGPLSWAGQVWSVILSSLGSGCLAVAVWRGRTRGEKRRALLVLAAVVAPVLAHAAYVLGLQSWNYSLAPLTLGVTAVLFVYGVEAYGVLEAQPIVRSDVLEHLHDALVLADTSGVVLDANAAAETILQTPRKALQGRGISEVLGAVTSPEDACALAEHVATLVPGEDVRGEIGTRDGRVFEVTSAAVRAHGDQPAGVFLTLRDRSQQRRNERLIRERQKLESVGILAAGVAHEVNNPLAFVRANLVHLQSLSGQIEKLAAQTPDAATSDLREMPEILAESLEGIERIGRIVESMLRFSRAPEEGSRPVDINEVVEESIRLADLHRDRSVEVESRLAADIPKVLGSADRLVQVLLNLLLNGKQALAGNPGGRILVETAGDEQGAIIQVRDDGSGIPEPDLQRIFDPFFTTRSPDEGTGLGLSIAFDIVREHKGLLEVESDPGEGTCFTIRLPAFSD